MRTDFDNSSTSQFPQTLTFCSHIYKVLASNIRNLNDRIVFKVEVDTDADGTVDQTVYLRVPIFDESLENEYWEYENEGLKILQVRIYEWGTDVSENDSSLPSL